MLVCTPTPPTFSRRAATLSPSQLYLWHLEQCLGHSELLAKVCSDETHLLHKWEHKSVWNITETGPQRAYGVFQTRVLGLGLTLLYWLFALCSFQCTEGELQKGQRAFLGGTLETSRKQWHEDSGNIAALLVTVTYTVGFFFNTFIEI